MSKTCYTIFNSQFGTIYIEAVEILTNKMVFYEMVSFKMSAWCKLELLCYKIELGREISKLLILLVNSYFLLYVTKNKVEI